MNEQSLALTAGFVTLADHLAEVIAGVAAETVELPSHRIAAE
jgi:hypothetical protein